MQTFNTTWYSLFITLFGLFCRQLHEIERCNLKDVPEQDVLGSGVFGYCKKMLYRGHVVAVKFFNKTSLDAVKEASMIQTFDNEGILCTVYCAISLKLPRGSLTIIMQESPLDE